jgi:phasin family protein
MAKTSSTTFFDPELVNTPVLNQWQAEFNRAVADLGKFWSNGSTNNIDVSWLLSCQQKNIEALTAANECAFEGARAIAKRQTEFAREAAEVLSKVTKELISVGNPEDKFAKQAGAAKEAFETSITNVTELAKLVQQSRTETFDVICKRVIESFEEVKAAFEPKPAKKAA